MHLIIPYAACCSQGYADALPALHLPNLQKLLAKLSPLTPDQGDEFSLSPPHERVLARACGLGALDGQIPWAARHALQRDDLDHTGKAWAFITLCHWQVNTGHITMSPLPLPRLTPTQSDALLAAMRPYFEEDGIRLLADEPGRWLAQGDVFAGLATASTDRVVGRDLALWMTTSPQAAPLRRLQNEMQMLLYTHPVNDEREALRLPPVNSFWLHGAGALPDGYQEAATPALPEVIDTLRGFALAENWSGWTQAWQALDATRIQAMLTLASRGEAVRLTLCGERSSQCWQSQSKPAWQKLKAFFSSQPLSAVLGKL